MHRSLPKSGACYGVAHFNCGAARPRTAYAVRPSLMRSRARLVRTLQLRRILLGRRHVVVGGYLILGLLQPHGGYRLRRERL